MEFFCNGSFLFHFHFQKYLELNANWMKRLTEAQRDFKFKITTATQRWGKNFFGLLWGVADIFKGGLPRAVNLHSFFADPDPAVFLNADPDPAAF